MSLASLQSRWVTRPEKILLQTPLCDLAGLVDDSLLRELQSSLYEDLERLQIKLRPRLWLSDEWFCPDGLTGFAVPFYLAIPKIQSLMRRFAVIPEGTQTRLRQQYLRHECGHAIDNAYLLRRSKRRQTLFGKSCTPYPHWYLPLRPEAHFVKHLAPSYAQAHPDEDFAECIAVKLNPHATRALKMGSEKLAQKMALVEELLQGIAGKAPPKIAHREIDPLSGFKTDLGTWLQRRQRLAFRNWKKTWDQQLTRIFPHQEGGSAAHRILAKHKATLSSQLRSGTSVDAREINWLLDSISRRTHVLNLKTKANPAKALDALHRHLLSEAKDYIRAKAHHIAL